MSQMLTLSADDKAKIKTLIENGVKTTREIATLRESLGEYVKATAAEIGVKPAFLNKAIRVAHKSSVSALQEDVDTIEEILHAAGIA